MIQYAPGRYVNSSKINSAIVFKKQAYEVDDKGEYPLIWKVAIDLDVLNPENSVVYSAPYSTEKECLQFLGWINNNLD